MTDTANTNDASSVSTMSSLMGMVNSVKEKWDSSGANDAIAQGLSAVPQDTKDSVKSLFNREHLRSITVFFGIGEERPFYIEKSPSLIVERLRHNITFFYLNYSLLFAVLFVLTILISPSALIGIALLAVAWMYIIRSTQEGSMKLGPITVQQKHATIGMAGLSVLVLFWLLQHIFWWTLASGSFMCLVHASLRDASLHKDEEDKVAMSGDLDLTTEDAAFINQDPPMANATPVAV